MRKAVSLLCALLFLAGLGVMLYPVLHGYQGQMESSQEVARLKQQFQQEQGQESVYQQLQKDMQTYNEQIYQEEQRGLVDAWSYQQSPFDFAKYGLEEQAVGYLSIPAMEQELPLYLGATDENLAKGAAVLGQTSMPIGGENTNTVIAAHRGWKGIAMFRDIERLQVGDQVALQDFWGTLDYTVVEIGVIQPDDIDAVKIQPGKEMLTLITCHPYPQNTQRYVVYCQRVQEGLAPAEHQLVLGQEQHHIVPSQPRIEGEQWVQRIALGAVVLLLGGMAVLLYQRKRRQQGDNKQH